MFDLSTRILVVDDMLTMRKLVQKACKEIGFTDFIEAADGAKAFEALTASESPVGLVLSDWNMPNCTGLDFLKRVRSDSRYADLPFILITAEAEKEQIVEAIKSGVTNYVVKPFTADMLKGKLAAAYAKVTGG